MSCFQAGRRRRMLRTWRQATWKAMQGGTMSCGRIRWTRKQARFFPAHWICLKTSRRWTSSSRRKAAKAIFRWLEALTATQCWSRRYSRLATRSNTRRWRWICGRTPASVSRFRWTTIPTTGSAKPPTGRNWPSTDFGWTTNGTEGASLHSIYWLRTTNEHDLTRMPRRRADNFQKIMRVDNEFWMRKYQLLRRLGGCIYDVNAHEAFSCLQLVLNETLFLHKRIWTTIKFWHKALPCRNMSSGKGFFRVCQKSFKVIKNHNKSSKVIKNHQIIMTIYEFLWLHKMKDFSCIVSCMCYNKLKSWWLPF